MKWVLCTDNDGYPASLQRMKVYRVIEDKASEEMGCVRIVDETGEDYAFPDRLFVPLQLAAPVEERLLALV